MAQENYDALDLAATTFQFTSNSLGNMQRNHQTENTTGNCLQRYTDILDYQIPCEDDTPFSNKLVLQHDGERVNEEDGLQSVSFQLENEDGYEAFINQMPSEFVDAPLQEITSQAFDELAKECNGERIVSIKILDCPKKRNPPYLVTEEQKLVTTLPSHCVHVRVNGTSDGDKVQVFMRYKEDLYHHTPVKSCMNHREFVNRPEDLPQEFNFYVSTWTKTVNSQLYKIVQGHPAVEKMVDLNDMIKDGPNLEFSCVFLCPNSCHKPSRELSLVLKLLNQDNEELVCEEYDLRVCKNVKRDHKERLQQRNNKRSADSSNLDNKQHVVKCAKFSHFMKQEAPEESAESSQDSELYQGQPAPYPQTSPASTSTQATSQCLLVQLKSERHRRLVQEMVIELGGTTTPVSVQLPPPLQAN